jgi:hypothetical protein
MILKKSINFKGRKFRWNKESTGPVGRLSTEGLSDVFELYAQELGSSTNAETLKSLRPHISSTTI